MNALLQVPSLGVVVYLVIHFLAYLRSARADEREFMAGLVKDQSEIMDRNTRALQQTYEMLNETRETLAQTRLVIEQHCRDHPAGDEG
ncbi:hypothetical protein [Crateriforma conspicua]|nr:hypothetical protein [Crateriforma conspicua]